MEEVIKKCKCGVFLTVNEHRDYYMSVEDRIKEINENDYSANGHHEDYEPEIDDELKYRLVKADCIYDLHFYPDTPVGSYQVYGTSLQEVINRALEILK